VSDPAIVLDGVGKQFRQVKEGDLLIRRLVALGRNRGSYLWALRDISFECARGETLGIIGRNGSGKTTLLRILAGVSAPTTGRIRIEGSISPLIGVGVGFNNELTGRENVYANGQILGMSKERIRREFDEIVAFSEIEEFLDVPVKFYSSGMFLRLAFAVAIHVRPEVLLIDEVLAVGDIAFQAKCVDRMRALQDGGATVLVVTHSIPTLHRMCDRTVVLSQGRAIYDGPTEQAISIYHDVMQAEGAQTNAGSIYERDGKAIPHLGVAQVGVELIDAFGNPSRHFSNGQPVTFRVHAEFQRPASNPILGLLIAHPPTGALYMTHMPAGEYFGTHGPGRPLDAVVTLQNPLLAATYRINAVVLESDGTAELGRSQGELFRVTKANDPSRGLIDMDARFHIGDESFRPRQAGLRQ